MSKFFLFNPGKLSEQNQHADTKQEICPIYETMSLYVYFATAQTELSDRIIPRSTYQVRMI